MKNIRQLLVNIIFCIIPIGFVIFVFYMVPFYRKAGSMSLAAGHLCYALGVVIILYDLLLFYKSMRIYQIHKNLLQHLKKKNITKKERLYQDDVSEIAAAMEQVMQDYEHVNKESEKQEEDYARLIPRRLFELLGVKDISDVTVGRQVSADAVIMTVNTVNIVNLMPVMKSKEIFDLINRVLSKLVPIVENSGGVIDKFVDAGLTAVYTGGFANALQAAVTLCEIVDQMADEAHEYKDFSVGLTYGTLMIGMMGYESRMSAVVISESINSASFLQKTAGKYYAKILITSEYADYVKDFKEKYNYRLLGYFYNQTTKKIEKIYDVYDGDRSNIKYMKKKSRMIFETGVEKFVNGDYEQARIHFVEVLRTNRFDLAAREYLLLCDKYFGEQNWEHEVYLERY